MSYNVPSTQTLTLALTISLTLTPTPTSPLHFEGMLECLQGGIPIIALPFFADQVPHTSPDPDPDPNPHCSPRPSLESVCPLVRSTSHQWYVPSIQIANAAKVEELGVGICLNPARLGVSLTLTLTLTLTLDPTLTRNPSPNPDLD